MNRKDFVKVVAVGAAGLGLPALALEDAQAGEDTYRVDSSKASSVVFPQGVLSGDPKPSSLILWTRVAETAPTAQVAWQVSESRRFNRDSIIAQGVYNTEASVDYTVRVKLTNLDSYTHYFYRFIYKGAVSITGRTLTAPESDCEQDVRFAYISCQDYTNGFYSTLGALVEEKLDFMVHLGDYIYETVGESFQGSVRTVNLPDGKPLPSGGKYANTLADYRNIYRTYRSDAQMQALNARFPLVAIWDDHEFSDDCWGATSTYFGEAVPEFTPDRRKTANKVWFEYMPVDIPAFDGTKPYDQSLSIHRSFRFGKLLELIMTDERLYRSDHLIPEGPAIPAIGHAANSYIGSRYFVPKQYFDGLQAAKPPISMLGATQKQWFKDKLKNSQAKWKFWGSEVSLQRMLLDLTPYGATKFYFDLDQWDGYGRERSELMKFLKDNRIKNVVGISGDIHAFFAGKVFEDYDKQNEPATMVDFTGAGVSSSYLFNAIYGGVAAPGSPFAALEPLLRYNPATDKNGVDTFLQVANPNIKFVRSRAYGYSVVKVMEDKVRITFNEMEGIDRPDRPVKYKYPFVVKDGIADIIVRPTQVVADDEEDED